MLWHFVPVSTSYRNRCSTWERICKNPVVNTGVEYNNLVYAELRIVHRVKNLKRKRETCYSATIYGALAGHCVAGYAAGRMKTQEGNRKAATQHPTEVCLGNEKVVITTFK